MELTTNQSNGITLNLLLSMLADSPQQAVQIVLPNQSHVPVHFHVTEVGRVQKDFIDCGGTPRSTASCVIQAWVADDLEHRLNTNKLAQIIQKGVELFPIGELPIEVEYDTGVISQYPVLTIEKYDEGIRLHLGSKHTTCLAPERCGVTLNVLSPCSGPGCC